MSALLEAAPARAASSVHMDYLTVVALVQNEKPYLAEWMSHHSFLGADAFVLYDNDSTDGTAAEGRLLGATVIDWPGRNMPQLTAHRNALEILRGRTVWAAFIDPDEFILPDAGVDLTEELQAREGLYSALAMNWACFGTSDLDEQPIMARPSYIKRCHSGDSINKHIKSIVRVDEVPVLQPKDPHHFLGVRTVNFAGETIIGPFSERVNWEGVRLNHYISRSIPEAAAKMRKRRPNTNDFYSWDLRDAWLNEYTDTSMSRFVPIIREA